MENRKTGNRYLLLLLLLAAVSGILLCNRYLAENCFVGGRMYPVHTASLNLRGGNLPDTAQLGQLRELRFLDLRDTELTPLQYEELAGLLPECEILWSVPLSGGKVDSDISAISLQKFHEEDLRMLKYLTKLELLDAVGCRDYGLLLEAKETYPALVIRYTVPLGDREYPADTRELTLENADGDQLDAALMWLPELRQVTLNGQTPEKERVGAWMAQYPQITFVWSFEVCGVPASSLDTKLILNEIPMESVAEVETALDYFYDLQWVEMCGCGISSQEMDALWKRHPETRFVWAVQVGRCNLRTDVTSFMPYQFGYDGFSKLRDAHMTDMKYCVDLVCMDLGHMGITDYSFLEYMPKLKYLILADTPGTDFSALANLKELVFLEIFMTKFDQAEVLTGLTKLEDLNIGNSRLDHIEPLLEMTWLKRLWLPGNVLLSHEERSQLRNTLTDTIVTFASAGSTGAGWRESPNYYAMRDMLNMGYAPGW